MRREFHVRFSEGLGVRFPGATHLLFGFEVEEDAKKVKRFFLKLQVQSDAVGFLPLLISIRGMVNAKGHDIRVYPHISCHVYSLL